MWFFYGALLFAYNAKIDPLSVINIIDTSTEFKSFSSFSYILILLCLLLQYISVK